MCIRDRNRTGINNDESAVGFWFADKDDFAFNNEYHPVRYDVYLKMDNPLIIEGKGTETNPWVDTDIDNLDPYTKFEKMFNDLMYQDPQMWDERVSESLYGGFETQKIKLHFANLSEGRKREVIKSIVDKLKTQGYDGIIIKNTQFDSVNPDERINQYVVFEPNQIKSVDNRGSFRQTDDNIYYQFAGENALTADTNSLSQARTMELNDYSDEEIYKETGWFRGKDNKWRFEISDDEAVFDLSNVANDTIVTLDSILQHDKLFAAYPELRNLSVMVDSNMKDGDTAASFQRGVWDEEYGLSLIHI